MLSKRSKNMPLTTRSGLIDMFWLWSLVIFPICQPREWAERSHKVFPFTAWLLVCLNDGMLIGISGRFHIWPSFIMAFLYAPSSCMAAKLAYDNRPDKDDGGGDHFGWLH